MPSLILPGEAFCHYSSSLFSAGTLMKKSKTYPHLDSIIDLETFAAVLRRRKEAFDKYSNHVEQATQSNPAQGGAQAGDGSAETQNVQVAAPSAALAPGPLATQPAQLTKEQARVLKQQQREQRRKEKQEQRAAVKQQLAEEKAKREKEKADLQQRQHEDQQRMVEIEEKLKTLEEQKHALVIKLKQALQQDPARRLSTQLQTYPSISLGMPLMPGATLVPPPSPYPSLISPTNPATYTSPFTSYAGNYMGHNAVAGGPLPAATLLSPQPPSQPTQHQAMPLSPAPAVAHATPAVPPYAPTHPSLEQVPGKPHPSRPTTSNHLQIYRQPSQPEATYPPSLREERDGYYPDGDHADRQSSKLPRRSWDGGYDKDKGTTYRPGPPPRTPESAATAAAGSHPSSQHGRPHWSSGQPMQATYAAPRPHVHPPYHQHPPSAHAPHHQPPPPFAAGGWARPPPPVYGRGRGWQPPPPPPPRRDSWPT